MKKYSKVQIERIEKHHCILCDVPVTKQILFCPKCANKRRWKSKIIRLNRQVNNLCVYCGKPLEQGEKRACDKCKKRQCNSVKKTQRKRREKGLCRCGKIATIGLLCENCWFKHTSLQRTGETENWLAIKQLLEGQKYQCFYTKRKLILGKNASLDHIIPTSKNGDNSIKNLQWVDEQVNRIKNDMTHNEFIKFCHLISQSFP